MIRNRSIFAALLIVLIAVVPSTFAQTTTAQITGTVTTGSSPLPGVTVTIASPNMQGTRDTVSGEAGGYSFAGVPPGEYTVKFELSGMGSTTKTVSVGVGQTGRADADLKVSAVTEAITVTATAQTVLETPTVSQNLSAKLVDSLPTARTVIGTALLAPGVNGNTTAANQLSISGSPGYDNLVMVNGVAITEEVRSQALPLFIEDSIQETTVMTGAISAEYGRFTGGVVNSISKSGGNEFSGSFRDNLSNPTWTSRTPGQLAANTKLRDTLSSVYQETLGGYILRDRLWFFAAGRQTKADTPGSLRLIPGAPASSTISYDTLTKEKRYEGKLTGQIASKHNLSVSYLNTDQKTTDTPYTTTSYDAAQLSNRHDPYKLYTANYNGVLTNNWLLEGVYSKMHWGVAEGNGSQFTDFINGTIVRNRADGSARFNSPTFCGVCDTETRSNDSVTLKTSYFLSTKNWGNQNLVGGVEQFREHRFANNYQSGSNFRVFVNSVQLVNGKIIPTLTPGPGGSAAYIEWTPIFALQQNESNLATNSAFINDRWDLNERWSFNIGARYDKNDATDGSGNKVAKDSKITPRLSATYDLTGNGRHRITASYGEYASRIVDGPATAASSAGNPGSIYFAYLGPAINPAGTPTDQLVDTHQALQIVQNWLNGACNAQGQCGTSNLSLLRANTINALPGYDTRIDGSLSSPYVREYTVGYGAQWTSSLYTRLDLVSRDWRDFYARRVDSSTPKLTDPLGIQHDVGIVENTNDITRKYRGAQFQGGWRAHRFNVGVNYTYSTLKGNDEQESATSGTVGNFPGSIYYPEINNISQRLPIGYLASDERHRARAYAGYDLPLPAVVGLVNLSVLENYDSGLPYSAVGTIDVTSYLSTLLPTNHYVSVPSSSVQYYFGGRGTYRLPTITSTNLALNYERAISRLVLFGHIDFLNVFNEDAVSAVNTSITTAATSTSFAPFNPFNTAPVECPQGTAAATCKASGANWQKGVNFGKPASITSYQTARSYSFNFGVRF